MRLIARHAALAAALLVLGGRSALGADASAAPALTGRVEQVVAAAEGVAVLRGGGFVQLGATGQLVGRCGGTRAVAGRGRRLDGTTIPAERVLRDAGFPEADESAEAEALLEDEGIDPPSRGRTVATSAGLPRAVAVAGTPAAAFIATDDGLWRRSAGAGGCERAGLGGRALELVAAEGDVVVAISGVTVWRSSDGGASFHVAAILTARARAVALADGGATALVADDDGVVAVAAPRSVHRVLDRPSDAVVSCGEDTFVLAADGVYRVGADGVVARMGDRPPARALACSAPTGPHLIAGGVGVWTTTDGRLWREDAVWLGRSLTSVAFSAGHAWLATEDGLYASPSLAGVAAPVTEPDRAVRGARPGPPSWSWLLPRVGLAFDGWTSSRARSGWRLFVLVTLTLDRRSSPRLENLSEALQ